MISALANWDYKPQPTPTVSALRKQLRVSRATAELIARSGFSDAEAARTFLYPRLSQISCPFEVPNLQRAAERICQAIDNGQRIVICGDYDVDGVTSTALLVDILQRFDTYPKFIVPLRLEEGYGLTRRTAERAMDCGESADLFIALDCGTNSVEEAEFILSQGCDLIIVDHHQAKRSLPDEALLVNPHVYSGEISEAVNFCTVGLVFKLAHGILKLKRERNDAVAFDIKLREYLDFVSMGTIADLVPLTNENRIFTRVGLKSLSKTKRKGLGCLMRVSGMNASHGVNPIDVSYKLGPRINASGRLADASMAVELLLSDDAAFCMETSLKLDSFNRERQEIEKAIVEEAKRQVEATQPDHCGLVVFGESWHPGVVGIVASRLSRDYERPCIVLGLEGDLAKGSGRSVEGVNLVQALSGFSDRLESWGGHPMAVGVNVQLDRIDELRAYFHEAIRSANAAPSYQKTIDIAAYLELEDINSDFMEELAFLQPFGQENPEPVFVSRNIRLRQRPKVFKDAHFRFSLSDRSGRPLQGVAWNMAKRMPEQGASFDAAYRLAWNSFGRHKALQMELVDWKYSNST